MLALSGAINVAVTAGLLAHHAGADTSNAVLEVPRTFRTATPLRLGRLEREIGVAASQEILP